MKEGSELVLFGIRYVVISAKPYTHLGRERTWVTLRRPKGKKLYYAAVYENGVISEPV